jgi:DNA-binding CsgD family transcriptional regulator
LTTTRRPISTPVLIGRDDLLDLGRRRAQAAREGKGHLLFLAGEAGIGKTRLLGSLEREAVRQGMRVVRAGVTPSDLDLPGSLFLDLSHVLATSSSRGDRERGEAMRSALLADRAGGDAQRRRRLLVMALSDEMARLGATGPAMIAMEDLHWADDLTLEAIGHFARRLPTLRILVVGTYRSDELYPRVPMREWRSMLLTHRLAEEARLARLSLQETSTMATLLLGPGLPAPHDLAQAIQRRSDGIPLHVEEMMAAARFDGPGADAVDLGVPDTLTDAILRRRDALRRRTGLLADAAAVIGRSFDADLLAAAADVSIDVVADGLVELGERYLVVSAGRPEWFDVRHAVIRDVLAAAIPIGRRRRLHARIAQHLSTRPRLADDGFLSRHYEAAGLADEAFAHARRAAAAASSLSAHREALDLYRRATRCAPAGLPPEELAEMLAARAEEEAATDDNEAAAATLEDAQALYRSAGRRTEAAALAAPLVAARHLLGDGLDARVATLRAGLEEVDDEADAQRATAVRARLLAGLSAAYMLDRRLEEAADLGGRAVDLAEAAEDAATRIHASITLGSVLVFAGSMETGWERLVSGIRQAREGRLESEAARGYRMIGSSASVLVAYDLAERWLREGIEYAERTEQWNHRHYMAAHLGHVLWATGRWDEAESVTRHALADGRGGITTRITALHVLGFLALGRGEWEAADAALLEARALGERMAELQRFSPAVWGLAEGALLRGSAGEAATLTEEGRRASVTVRDAAYLFPLLVTGVRARLQLGLMAEAEAWAASINADLRHRSIPGTLPAIDHAAGLLALARGLTGQAREHLRSARSGWADHRRIWEELWATIDLARCSVRSNRPAEAASLAAHAAARAEALRAVPLQAAARDVASSIRRPSRADDAWAPLTAREFQVARLIADGRTNRDIAAELAITPKTAASHVEHILAKLGADRRTEIAAWVASLRPD